MTNPTTPAAVVSAAVPLGTKIVVSILLIGGLGWAGHAWLAEHDARVKAEASVASLQKSIGELGADKQQLLDQQKQRDAQTAGEIAKITTAAAAVKTPQQIAKYIPQAVSQLAGQANAPLPAPITATIAPATPQNPIPPAVVTIPQTDLGQVKDFLAACQTNAVALPGAQQDLSSCAIRAKLDDQQLADAQKQVQTLQLELKGGTFWHRVKVGAKKVAIGAAIGAAAACAAGACRK